MTLILSNRTPNKKALHPNANMAVMGRKAIASAVPPEFAAHLTMAALVSMSLPTAYKTEDKYHTLSAITCAIPIHLNGPSSAAVQANSSEETSRTGVKVSVSANPTLSEHKSPIAFSSSRLFIVQLNIIYYILRQAIRQHTT
jgi:hypothetical protein